MDDGSAGHAGAVISKRQARSLPEVERRWVHSKREALSHKIRLLKSAFWAPRGAQRDC